MRHSVANHSSRRRPGTTYYLTREQVLYLAAKSETPRATEVLQTMIAVFAAVLDGQSTAGPALLEQLLGELADEREMRLNMQEQMADIKAMLMGGMTRPCGRTEKRTLTGLAAEVAALQLQMEARVPVVMETLLRSPEFRKRRSAVIQEAAKAQRLAGYRLDLLTLNQAALIRCWLEDKRASLTKALRPRKRTGGRSRGTARQLNLVR